MRAAWALTLNGFREARRNRVSVVVIAFTVAMLLSSTLVTEVTIWTMERVLTDFGLALMSLTLVLLAVFLSSGTLTREIERKTLFLIVSKPVSRATFLLARYAATMLTLAVLLAVMAALFLAQVKLYGAPITAAQLWAIVALWFELLVVAAIGFLLASFSGQMVAAVVTTGLFFAGHLSADLYALADKTDSRVLGAIARGTYYLLPNLDRINFRPAAAYELTPPAADLASGFAYAALYAGACMTLAVLLFQRRDFK